MVHESLDINTEDRSGFGDTMEPRRTWGGFLRPRFGLRWLFVLFLLTADYCLKIRFAHEDMKLNFRLPNVQNKATTLWVPFYVHYEVRNRASGIERSYVGAFGCYWLWRNGATMYHLRFPTNSGIEEA